LHLPTSSFFHSLPVSRTHIYPTMLLHTIRRVSLAMCRHHYQPNTLTPLLALRLPVAHPNTRQVATQQHRSLLVAPHISPSSAHRSRHYTANINQIRSVVPLCRTYSSRSSPVNIKCWSCPQARDPKDRSFFCAGCNLIQRPSPKLNYFDLFNMYVSLCACVCVRVCLEPTRINKSIDYCMLCTNAILTILLLRSTASLLVRWCREKRYDLDVGALEKAYTSIQRTIHPDLFARKSEVCRTPLWHLQRNCL
jgi:hypothetical protein